MDGFFKSFGGRESNARNEEMKSILVKDIKTNPHQPRKNFAPEQLEELRQSIKEYGVLQPVIVRRVGGNYELVAGERRLRAAALAGLERIPAVVRSLDEREVALVALVENLQREDLDYFEEAEGYASILKNFSLTQEELAKSVGRSQSAVANKLRLLKLGEKVRQHISREIMTERHVRALLRLSDEAEQLSVIREVTDKALNVRLTEALIDEVMSQRDRDAESKIIPIKRRKRIIRIVKDIRIYLNALKSTIKAMREAGLAVSIDQKEGEGYLEFHIRVPTVGTKPL